MLQPSITIRIIRVYARNPPLFAMLNMALRKLMMKLVFCRAAMIAMKEASITMVELEKPPKAVLMSTTPNTTIKRHARSGGAPKGSLSVMIRTIMNAVISSAMIIGTVICVFSSHFITELSSYCCIPPGSSPIMSANRCPRKDIQHMPLSAFSFRTFCSTSTPSSHR